MNTMMMNIDRKKILASLLVIVMMSFYAYSRVEEAASSHNRQAVVETFRSGDGWGYQITINDKVFIHQPIIPALEISMPFPDKESARKVGTQVLARIKSNKKPTVTKDEIQEWLRGYRL